MEYIRVRLVEDNPGAARVIQDMVADTKTTEFSIGWKQTLKDGLESLGKNNYDAILLDLGLPDSPQSSTTFTRVQSTVQNLSIIILTGLDYDTFAVSTVQGGAQDYLVKGKINTNTLVRTIPYALYMETSEPRNSVESLRKLSLSGISRYPIRFGFDPGLPCKKTVYS